MLQPDSPQSEPRLTLAGTLRGMLTGTPMVASGFIYGLAFGMLANDMGLSVLEAVLMSATVFSGSAQVAVVQTWQNLGGVMPAFLIVVIANVRYILTSATLRPWFGALPKAKSALALAFMVDSAYATAMRRHLAGEGDAGSMLGPSLMSYVGWVVATGLGFSLGRLLANPKAVALDFVVIAFCTAAATEMARASRDWAPAIAAVAMVIALDRFMPGPWTVVGAGLAAACVAAVRFKSEVAAA